MEENDPLGILTKKSDPSDPLGILKKKSTLPTFGEQMAQRLDEPQPTSEESGTPSAENVQPAGVKKSPLDIFDIRPDIQNLKAQAESNKDERKQKLVQYYDKVSGVLDAQPGNGAKMAYKNWSAETGMMERYNYLEEKAASESEERRKELGVAVEGINKLQEDRRKAATSGNMEEYTRLNDLVQKGAEYLRTNKIGADQDYNTKTGLQLWEESVGFTSEMLNAKMESLLSNPQTNEKVNRLFALTEQIQKTNNPELIKEHERLITEPDITEINKLSKRSDSLINTEKGLALKYPQIFKDRLDKKAKQEQIDKVFESRGPVLGVAMGVKNQLGRSATGFISDLAKIPSLTDYNNKYDWRDKWAGAVDFAAENIVNDIGYPIPSDYNKPLIYEDEKGNTVFRTDLILPKTAKVGGDMAALLYGAGKISALGKAVGFSSKVSTGIGLFTSSYVQTHDDYKNAGLGAGMSPEDAQWFATAAGATTSALELISPNKYLWGEASESLAKSFTKNIAGGMSRRAALKESMKTVPKEIFGENLQELSQMVGDKAIEKGSELLSGNDYFANNSKDVVNEAIETMVLTTIVAGAPAAVASGLQFANREAQYKEAVRLVAENRDKYLPLLQQAFSTTKATPEEVRKIMDDVDSITTPKDGAPLYKIGDETVSRTDIEQSIKDGKLNDLYVANDKPLESILNKATNLTNKADVAELVKTPDVTVKPEPKEKTADGKVKEETPEDKAKALARAKIDALVQTGDLKYDGKRATVLTEHGGEQLSFILDEMQRSLSEPVQVTRTKAKSEQPVQKNEKTEQITEPVQNIEKTEQIVETSPITGQADTDLSQFTTEQTEPETKRIAEVLTKAKATLSKLSPNLRVSLYDGSKDPAGKRGFYDPKTNTIGIDLSKADATTAFHEAYHPIIEAVKQQNPELFTKMTEEAANEEIDLADGTKQKYSDYTKGDKKEALIEYLADFSDGKFDEMANSKSITDKVKDFIGRILKAIGVKPSDFNVDLDKVDDLKDFADQMATAISKGKTINFEKKSKTKTPSTEGKVGETKTQSDEKGRQGQRREESLLLNQQDKTAEDDSASSTQFQNQGAKKKLKRFEKKTGKKINKTARDIALDKKTQHKEIAVHVLKNPADVAYDPQKYKDIDAYLDVQSDVDLFNMIDINNSMAVLAGIKLLRRYNLNNATPNNIKKDPIPVFKKLREIGTGVGQLLRQFGELKNRTPQGIVSLVVGNLESLNLDLPTAQLKELEKLAADHIQALDVKEAKRVAYLDNPTPQTKKALDDADNELAESFQKLNTFIGMVTPIGIDSLLGTILQGNLLVSKSIVTNVLSNVAQQPLRQAELFSGDIATYIVNEDKINMMNPVQIYFGAALHGLKYSSIGFGKAFKDIIKGRNAEMNSSLEVRRNLKPMQALWQIVTKEGRSTLPINPLTGKTPTVIKIEKILEGTLGWPAEGMFRMLYLGDKPFKDGARIAGAYRIFAQQGGRSSADFRKFMANLNTKQKDKIQNYADEATFSDKRYLSENADKMVATLNKSVDRLADYSDNENFKHAVKAIGRTLLKANIPFVRVPSNLLQNLVELALPPVPLIASAMYAKKDPRKSAQLFTRAMVGFGLYYLGNMLYDAGIIIASGEDDEENERQLKQEVARPNGINMSALARFYAGGDPAFQLGDDIRDFSKLGLLGMFLAYNAEWNESIAKNKKVPRNEASFVAKSGEALGAILQTSLEMSFLQGSYVALDAMKEGDFSNYIPELGNTLSAIVIPNQYAATFTRPRAEYILRAKDKEALTTLNEKLSIKRHAQLKDNIAGVYPIIGMFGDPVQQTPLGKNSIVYHLFDITNSETITDPLALEVFNLSKRVGEIPIGTPEPTLTIEGKSYTVAEQDYIYLQMLAGRYKRLALGSEVNDPSWKQAPDEEKLAMMKAINESANSDMRNYMLGQIYEGIEAGRIILNEEMGTYSYVTPSEFDFDFAKKALKED